MNLPAFIQGYVDAALFACYVDLDCNETRDFTTFDQAGYGWQDLAPEAQDSVVKDCDRFLHDHRHLIPPEREVQAGMDFFFTRSGHGAGFWDGGWPEHGATLTEACRPYGDAGFILGDDGRIYHEG